MNDVQTRLDRIEDRVAALINVINSLQRQIDNLNSTVGE